MVVEGCSGSSRWSVSWNGKVSRKPQIFGVPRGCRCPVQVCRTERVILPSLRFAEFEEKDPERGRYTSHFSLGSPQTNESHGPAYGRQVTWDL